MQYRFNINDERMNIGCGALACLCMYTSMCIYVSVLCMCMQKNLLSDNSHFFPEKFCHLK